MKPFPSLSPYLLLGCLLLADCGEKPLETSGATETGNTKVAGEVWSTDGTLAMGVRMELLASDANPLEPAVSPGLVDTIDAGGKFEFNVKVEGEYNVIGIHLKSGARLLIRNIYVSGDSVILPPDTLREPGAVKVFLNDLGSDAESDIYIAGTPFSAHIDQAALTRGYQIIDSLPVGLSPALFQFEPSRAPVMLVAGNSFEITAGDTILVNGSGAWKFSRKVYLNTTPAGADISGDVTGFPVLVRLDSTNFRFPEAQSFGEDLRFIKAGGSPLKFEITQWNPGRKRADIWVRVDSVYGNNDSQYVEMFWGNPDALPRSDGSGVFEKADGFVSVWHLDGEGTIAVNGYADATANRYHGTGVNMAKSAGVAGIVGGGQRFNGYNSFIDIPGSSGGALNFAENGRYTISAWVRVGILNGAYQTLVGKGDNQYNLQVSFENKWHFVEAKRSGAFEAVEVPAQIAVWKFITGVRDGTSQTLYIDGVPVANRPLIKSMDATRDESSRVGLGRNSQIFAQYFNGILDEVAMSNQARSADWVKLSFENQKPGQRLVK